MTIRTRATLDKELATLNEDILRLTSMVDTAIDQSMAALDQRDLQLAQSVIVNDEQINELRFQIEQRCQLILATQQPVGTDLRIVITAMHLATELERIGDHASGIARLVERMEVEPKIGTLHKLPKMAKRARKMLAESIQAYIDHDAELAQSMIRRDTKMDRHYHKLFIESLEEMRDDDYIQRATYLLWIGHNFERIGDRATNIAERVIFMVTGQFVENINFME